MKTLGLTRMALVLMLSGGTVAMAQQERLEVPGDNFSLEGALELFKKSSSPEEFEKLLNTPDSKVNNLDLNGDGYVDYIRVIDRQDGNVHAFILQAVVSGSESQDVAVIELEKLANGKAVLQITGDEDVYGIETIIEPTEEVRVHAGTTTTRTVVNVWTWPSVRYVYSPYYTTWVSPWYWTYYPRWWYGWRPVSYYVYDPWWRPYRSYYSVCYTHRVVYANRIYRPYRTTSVIVYNRYNNHIHRYRTQYGYDRDGRNRYDNRTAHHYDRHKGYDRDNRNSYGNRSWNTGDRDNRSGDRDWSKNHSSQRWERSGDKSQGRSTPYTGRSEASREPRSNNGSPYTYGKPAPSRSGGTGSGAYGSSDRKLKEYSSPQRSVPEYSEKQSRTYSAPRKTDLAFENRMSAPKRPTTGSQRFSQPERRANSAPSIQRSGPSKSEGPQRSGGNNGGDRGSNGKRGRQ